MINNIQTILLTILNVLIMWNKGLLQAIEVAKMVELLLPKTLTSKQVFAKNANSDFEVSEWYYLEAYQNCREQGITLWIPYLHGIEGTTFSICQHRSSDEIGYYVGKHINLGLSEQAYCNGFSQFDNSKECAEAIVAVIKAMIDQTLND